MREISIDECFVEIRNGANIKQGVIDGGYPITRIETLSNDKFNRDRMGYAGINDAEKYSGFILEDEDLLMSHINSVQYLGRTVLYSREDNEIVIHGMNLLRLKPKKDIIYPAYIKYYFSGRKFKNNISKITKKSVNQASFAVKDLKGIELQIPELHEQSRIAERLSIIERIIELRNKELEILDDLIKSRFVEMFGDIKSNKGNHQIKRIGDFADVLTGATPKRGNAAYFDGTIPWVKTGEISKGYIYNAEEYITEKAIKETNCKLLPPKTIMVAMYGQGKTRGQVGILEIDATTNQACAAILPNENYSSLFILNQLDLRYDELRELGRGGNQPNLNLSMIKNFEVILPELGIQYKFAEFVNQVDKLKLEVQKSLDETQLLFDSLMQKYFD